MIRPWYRSRLFWLGIPGLLFLLWLWWDSGAYSSQLAVHSVRTSLTSGGPGDSGEVVRIEIERGYVSILIPAATGEATHDWWISMHRDRFRKSGHLHDGTPNVPLRERRFDFPVGFRFLQTWDPVLGENAAEDGWVPSPGRTLPKPELKSTRVEIAWWAVLLAYFLFFAALMTGWQRRKVRLLEKSLAAVGP